MAMKKHLLVLLLLVSAFNAQSQLNVTLKSNLPYPNDALSNIGGYVDSLGNEYALVGYESGLSIVNVTDPTNPFIAFSVPGTNSIWREVKTWQNYAYVTTEGCCNGLQIVNLGYLPDSIQYKYYNGNGAIAGQIETIHALHVEDAHAYLFGSNLFNGAAVIVNLDDPWNPDYKGHTPGTYIHDGYVRNNTLYSAHIYGGFFSVFDVTDKTNPVLLATQQTPTQFTHNTWLNDAGTVLFTTDENTNSYLGSYDITDLSNITELDRLQLTPGSGSVIHNTHTIDDYEVISWYKDGIAIVDVSRPDNMIVTGHYDTYPQGAGNGFNGAWGVYPYLPSGNLVVSDIDNGLFVLTPDYIRGCYLEGTVTDSSTGFPLSNVTVTIIGPSITKQSKLNGQYKTGLAAAGTYDVQFAKPGYITKTVAGVNLQNGLLTNLDVALSSSVPSVTLSGTVTEAGSNQPISGATISFTNPQFSNTVTTGINGQFVLAGFFPGNYDITVGHWGNRTICTNSQNINGSSPLNFSLDKGYYDDFTLDFGWTVSGPSSNTWERAVPVATTSQGQLANPGNDVTGDCGNLAMVTDNGGGGPWDNDVDQGSTVLTSPEFDGTQYPDPFVKYYYWFFNGGTTNGQPDDSIKIYLTNGLTTVLVEAHGPSGSSSQWNLSGFRIADYMTPSPSMQIIVDVSDPGPIFNIVEGGLDKFEIVNVTAATETIGISETEIKAFPNPFTNNFRLKIYQENVEPGLLQIMDISGKMIGQIPVDANDGSDIALGENWPQGVYTVRFMTGSTLSRPIKIVKQ